MADCDMDSECSSSSRGPSPSSSPALAPVDSSPLSSPQNEPYILDSPPATRLDFAHPFAASAKANKRPPQREKKAATSPSAPHVSEAFKLYRGTNYSRSLGEDDYAYGDTSSLFSVESPPHRTTRYTSSDREERLWDEALRKPFDTGNGYIDMSNQHLKHIPASISDLSGFFNTTELSEQSLFHGRSLSRINTEPASHSRVRSFERTKSIMDSGKERHVLQLYLSGNDISFLPLELFTLQNLTVLSLRGNRLTYIPPEICQLVNLKELNISQNRLTYLPCEMRDMRLSALMLNPNPFLPEPSMRGPSASHNILSPRRSLSRIYSQRKEAAANISKRITISELTTNFPSLVPPLTEMCLRKLLCPLQGPSPGCVLSEYYGVPLHWGVPENLHDVLAENVPGIFRSADGVPPELRSRGRRPSQSMGTCANPVHKNRIFVRHAVERYTWERRVAGVDVGGTVPLRWRGCMRTCLGFLDEDVSEVSETEVQFMDVSDGMDVDVDVDESEVVQTVTFGGGLDMDDFDD